MHGARGGAKALVLNIVAFYLERERGGGAKRGEEQEEEELNRTCLLIHKPP